MKLPVLSLTLILALIMAGCTQTTPTPTVPESPQLPTVLPTQADQTPTGSPASLTLDQLQNAQYYAPYYQKSVTLVNGKSETGSGSDYLVVTLLPQVAFGDLNGDGIQDAAILLAENGGGSGTFVSLLAILNDNGKLVQAQNPALVDDRPIINNLTIKDGRIILDAVIHGPNDPMSSPTLLSTTVYSVSQGRLWLDHLENAAQAGSGHIIQIESPQWGSTVSQSVEVKGSMPIAPFEATLGYFIEDTSGNQLATGSFMVTSADVGAPATFDHTFDLTGIPSGTVIRISLFEGDMSGFHTYIALDTVELTVK